MGFSARQVDELSFWELLAQYGGWRKATGRTEDETMTGEDEARLGALVLSLRR